MKPHHKALWLAVIIGILIFLAIVFLPRVMHGTN